MRAIQVVAIAAWLLGCRSDARETEQRGAGGPAARPPSAAPSATPTGAPVLVFIPQAEAADCGAAAIAMTLNYYGHPSTRESAKAALHLEPDGTSALELTRVAEANGLGVAGVSVDADTGLPVFTAGDILWFDFHHFVVFEALVADDVLFIDPAAGRVALGRAAFRTHYAGVALLFERSPQALELRKRSIGLSSRAP